MGVEGRIGCIAVVGDHGTAVGRIEPTVEDVVRALSIRGDRKGRVVGPARVGRPGAVVVLVVGDRVVVSCPVRVEGLIIGDRVDRRVIDQGSEVVSGRRPAGEVVAVLRWHRHGHCVVKGPGEWTADDLVAVRAEGDRVLDRYPAGIQRPGAGCVTIVGLRAAIAACVPAREHVPLAAVRIGW